MAEAKAETPDPIELAVDEAIAICDGDIRGALRASLVANSFLAAEVERLTNAVSFGFTRGKTVAGSRRERKARPVARNILWRPS